jgi:hypothetical protein
MEEGIASGKAIPVDHPWDRGKTELMFCFPFQRVNLKHFFEHVGQSS